MVASVLFPGVDEAQQGDYVAARLACRYFRPGGVVRGVLQLHTSQLEPSKTTEVAYVVGQVHGHVSVDSNWLSVPVAPLVSPRSASVEERQAIETARHDSFFWDNLKGMLPDVKTFSGPTGACIYQSAPQVLFSELNITPPANATAQQLKENRKRCTREFAIALPAKLCPSFRGQAARVFYVLSLTVQTAAGAETKQSVSLHLPFELYATEYSFESSTLEASAAEEAHAMLVLSPRSAALQRDRSISVGAVPVGVRKGSEIPFELRAALMHGRVETEQKQQVQASIFTIGKDENHFVRFILPKQTFRPGEIILGVFDFSMATIACYEVRATLHMEEVLSTMSFDPDRVVQCKTIASFQEFTAGVLQSNVRFCIPQDAIPTIRTDLIRFQWLIRFEFIIGNGTAPTAVADRQVLRWETAINVEPPMASEREEYANIPYKLFFGNCRTTALS